MHRVVSHQSFFPFIHCSRVTIARKKVDDKILNDIYLSVQFLRSVAFYKENLVKAPNDRTTIFHGKAPLIQHAAALQSRENQVQPLSLTQ